MIGRVGSTESFMLFLKVCGYNIGVPDAGLPTADFSAERSLCAGRFSFPGKNTAGEDATV